MVQRLARSLVVIGGLYVASSFVALPLWAAERKGQRTADSAQAPPTNYVAIDSAEVRRILPPAPVAGSLADKADLETVLRVQAARTPSDVALAERVAMTDFGVIWPGYSNDQFPVTAKLLGEVFTDLAMVLASAKDLYQRPRPPKSHAEVKPCLIVPGSFSYPSGHSTVGFVFASVLGAIVPDKRADTLDRAHLFAWARVMGGVHYPCDIVGGRLLADAFVTRLIKNPDFQAKLRACRAELTSAPVGAHSGP